MAAIAPWFRLRLRTCGLRFESQAHHLRFFQFAMRTKINKRIGPFKTKTKGKKLLVSLVKNFQLYRFDSNFSSHNGVVRLMVEILQAVNFLYNRFLFCLSTIVCSFYLILLLYFSRRTRCLYSQLHRNYYYYTNHTSVIDVIGNN